MADEDRVTAPKAGMTESPTTDQPQTGPAAPDGTTGQDDQQGTTAPDGVKAEKEELYQTKYQGLMESQKKLLGKLGQYEQQYGPLETSQQTPQQQGQPEQGQQQEETFEFDPYDPESMKKYLDYQMGTMQIGRASCRERV